MIVLPPSLDGTFSVVAVLDAKDNLFVGHFRVVSSELPSDGQRQKADAQGCPPD